MDIEKIISQLPTDLKGLRTRQKNAERVLARNPDNNDASRLVSEIRSRIEVSDVAGRIQIGPLWWEPHNENTPEFQAYESADSTKPVASIFKHSTHTAIMKTVYAVRVGDRELPNKFSKIALARHAGSDAWLQMQKNLNKT